MLFCHMMDKLSLMTVILQSETELNSKNTNFYIMSLWVTFLFPNAKTKTCFIMVALYFYTNKSEGNKSKKDKLEFFLLFSNIV